jgi:uncharacterized protein YukE
MGQPFVQAVYDFGAADALLQVLTSGHDKVSGLVALRGSQRTSQLGSPHSDDWQGAKRDKFEREFSPEQRELSVLAENLRRLISAVENATAQAHAFNSANAAHAHK